MYNSDYTPGEKLIKNDTFSVFNYLVHEIKLNIRAGFVKIDFLDQIGTKIQAKRSIKTYVIQLVKGYLNHDHMTLHDLPFIKKWGVKNSLFQNFYI
jgi:hypothetical protein